MGCVVNGPGEAREADIGIAAGKQKGHLFIRGKIIRVVPEDDMVQALVDEAERLVAEGVEARMAAADRERGGRGGGGPGARCSSRPARTPTTPRRRSRSSVGTATTRGRTSLPSHDQGRHRVAGGGLPALVPGSDRRSRDGRQRPGPRHHGHPPVGVRDLGAHAGRARPPHQGGRRRERLLPALHPRVLPQARGGARRGLRARAGGRHPRRREGARGAAGRPAHQRDRDQPLLFQVGAEPPRPAAAHQPVGERGALGAAAAALPAHERVPLAGGPHGARDRGGRPRATRCASSPTSTARRWSTCCPFRC